MTTPNKLDKLEPAEGHGWMLRLHTDQELLYMRIAANDGTKPFPLDKETIDGILTTLARKSIFQGIDKKGAYIMVNADKVAHLNFVEVPLDQWLPLDNVGVLISALSE